MNCFSIWTGKPKGTATQLASTYYTNYVAPTTMNVTNASDWLTRGFWIRNKTRNDLRYVDYRSGNTLYIKTIDCGTLNFKNGGVELQPGMTIANATSGATITAAIDQAIFESGSWSNGTAAGTLLLKKYVGSSNFGTTATFYTGSQAAGVCNGISTRGFRGYSAQAWSTYDVVEPTSDIDIGYNLPAGGYYKNPVNETTAPDGVAFGHYPSQEECLIVESLLGGASVGIWIRQTILDGTQAREDVDGSLSFAWY
ncbi:MAG: hypothetical protein LBT05_14940 [Planctomycetaceae bacterium]|jgi:hypothetical protein|nr:hypothetical protein [Planctomycetaceae bacterium]